MTTPAAFTPAFAAWLTTSSREAAATFAIAARSSRRAISPTLINFSCIFVLPFQMMSGGPENRYFADDSVAMTSSPSAGSSQFCSQLRVIRASRDVAFRSAW